MGLGVKGLALRAQLVGEDVRDQILLRGEVGVEGAVRQAGVATGSGDTASNRLNRRLNPVIEMELGEDARDVVLDGVLAEV